MDPVQDESQRLVREAQRGDRRAVDRLIQRHRPRLHRMVRFRMDPRLRTRIDPSDVVQDALATALQQLEQYLRTEPIPFYPWLRRIAWQKLVHAHQKHLDAQKRSMRQEQANDWGVSDASALHIAQICAGNLTSPSGVALRNEARRRVREALGRLSELDREVLLQRYVEQLPAREIAAGLNTTEAAVHMRHMRALEKLHRLLSGDEP